MSLAIGSAARNVETTELAELVAARDDLSERLTLLAEAIPGRIAFSTSLGLEDQAILHAVVLSQKPIDVFTLDTGRLFPETLDTLVASELKYGIRIDVKSPDGADVERLVGRDGVLGFRLSLEARKACCDVRKVQPLRRALAGADAWLTGLRRGQATTRVEVPFVDWDDSYQLLKINPLADWSLDRLQDYVARNAIPINPLHQKGFPSIGCHTCTRAVRDGEDIRAGRWWWEQADGKECGLHNGRTAGARE